MENLKEILGKIPSVTVNSHSETEMGWKLILTIDIEHELSWRVVQEFASVINDLSVEEKLPAKFWPSSPPPYMNGGPEEYLTWVIESYRGDFSPEKCAEWISSRFPNPVDDESQWEV